MATIRTRSYFNGLFIKGYQPSQTNYEDLFLSIAMKKETSDRAKSYTGSSDLSTEQGLVVLATNSQVRSNATQLSDRSLVVQPHQLPSVENAVANSDSFNTNLGNFVGNIVQAAIDSGVTTRNKFYLTASTDFKTFLQTVFNLIATFLPNQTSNNGKYLKTDGTNASWDAIDISTSDVTGTLPINKGGTGQTTANASLNALLPSQTSNSGKVLQTDGTNTSWVTPSSGSGDIYKTTSTSSLTIPISTASRSFTLNTASAAYAVGMRLRVTDQASNSNYMEGIVTAFSGTSLTILVDTFGGSGTIAAWNINLSGISFSNMTSDNPELRGEGGTLITTLGDARYQVINKTLIVSYKLDNIAFPAAAYTYISFVVPTYTITDQTFAAATVFNETDNTQLACYVRSDSGANQVRVYPTESGASFTASKSYSIYFQIATSIQ